MKKRIAMCLLIAFAIEILVDNFVWRSSFIREMISPETWTKPYLAIVTIAIILVVVITGKGNHEDERSRRKKAALCLVFSLISSGLISFAILKLGLLLLAQAEWPKMMPYNLLALGVMFSMLVCSYGV